MRRAFVKLSLCIIFIPALVNAGDYTKIAKLGNASTVGISCILNDYMHYYGTGAIISSDGYILTSTTVVPPKAYDIWVYLTNHRKYKAVLVEYKLGAESALLKIDAKGLKAFPLAPGMPKIGQRAYTFGNSNNMVRNSWNASFSTGIISGLYMVQSTDIQSSYNGPAIETDAAVNPGQDGGPLINSYGQLCGIISLSYSVRRWQGVAVPINEIRNSLTHLKEKKVAFTEIPLIHKKEKSRGFSAFARGLKNSLVRLTIERKYPAEMLPRKSIESYLKTVADFETKTTDAKRKIVGRFYNRDEILATNQHLNRPPGIFTGFLISADGYILTSIFNLQTDTFWKHRKAAKQKLKYDSVDAYLKKNYKKNYSRIKNPVKKVSVRLWDNRLFTAKIIARHYPLGIALIKIEAKDLPFIEIDAKEAVLGASCAVIGITKHHKFTMNTGIISADSRDNGMRFQFDALANYGNSGGPLIDLNGNIIGICLNPMTPLPFMGRLLSVNELMHWQIAPNSGVSFSANALQLRNAIGKMKKGQNIHSYTEAFIGINPRLRKGRTKEVYISFVVEGSPAAIAGIHKGDILLSIDNKVIKSLKDVAHIVKNLKKGDRVEIDILRKGKQRYLLLNGKRIYINTDLQSFMKTLNANERITGKYIEVEDDHISITLRLR